MPKEELTELFRAQAAAFPLARENYEGLAQVVCRDLTAGDFLLRVQHNPARILSTSAKVDKESIRRRRCFLCAENRPAEQEARAYRGRYHILVNPYPIFTQHFTVAATEHVPQEMRGRYGDLLELAREFEGYTVFYNGPECGASAPDHFHFQMAPRHAMPVEEDCLRSALWQGVCEGAGITAGVLRNYLREVIVLRGDSPRLPEVLEEVQRLIGRHIPWSSEPMLNLLAWHEAGQWTVCVFPRRRGRPHQYFATGSEQILFSPGSVDMAGLIIAPRREDYERYSVELLTDLFSQVGADAPAWERIIHDLTHLSHV